MNILFTCAGRRNYLINYFKEALEGAGKVFVADMQQNAPSMIEADVAIQVPEIYDNNYIECIKNIVEKNNIKAIIPLNDLELPILSKNKKLIEESGARVIVSEQNVIDIAFDKWKTGKFLTNIGLNTPKTFINISEAKKAISNGELQFPLAIKPRWGSASIGIGFPESMKELDSMYELLTIQLKRTILNKVSEKDTNHSILIQEKLTGNEYGMDILNDFEGIYQGTFARKKLAMRAGETDKAVSVIIPELEKIGKRIGDNLKHIGNLDCDVFEHKGNYYVLELNPRFGGGYPFSHEAGINIAKAYISWLKGEKGIAKYNNYKEGVAFSKCDRLICINKK